MRYIDISENDRGHSVSRKRLRAGPNKRCILQTLPVGLFVVVLSLLSAVGALAVSQDCSVNTVAATEGGSESSSSGLTASDAAQSTVSQSLLDTGSSVAVSSFEHSASGAGDPSGVLGLLAPAPVATSGGASSELTGLVLSDSAGSGGLSQSSTAGSGANSPAITAVTAQSLLDGSVGAEGNQGRGGDCSFGFDLETGDSGDSRITAKGGDSGDAFGGDAIGGSSTAVGRSGDVAVGGQGGPGGSAGGSGDYAGAVIGNNSKGGGGNGGNGGYAVCIAGAVTGEGKSCSSGDVIVISGNGGNATGGDARSGDGGEAGVEDSGTGSTGDNHVR